VDTDRFFVICPNLLGGCRGTTGPGSINSETGKPYGRDFPTITLADMVEVQRRLIDHLGIGQLRAIVGGSLGGHQALTWATRFPDRVRGIVLLATSPRLTAQALAFDVVGRNAILRDPHFHGGQYYDKSRGPEVGLAIARMIGHITYLSPEAMTSKFDADRFEPRDVAVEFEKRFSVGSYLGYQGARFVERFDANSYMTLSLAMDMFDLGRDDAELTRNLAATTCQWLVISFSSDWLFPPEQSRRIVDALIANNRPVSFCNVQSNCGHDAFLLEDNFASYGEMTRSFLENLQGGAKPPREDVHGPHSIFRRHRLDYDRIVELVPRQASVLDLGCGSGGLLARLRSNGDRRLVGVEWDEASVLASIRQGLDVVQLDLNRGLQAFSRDQFDCVILSQTLQTVFRVESLIDDMLRIGRTCLVSIPNFAYRPLRRMLAEEGRAPKSSGVLRNEWYNTPNIRFFTIADFEEFCRHKNILVHKRIALDTESGAEVFEDANLNADLAIFVIGRAAESR
jgi:homoserine O-acetyltransferase